MSARISTIEFILTRDRQIVIAGLVGVILASWLFILAGAGIQMSDVPATGAGAGMAIAPAWTTGYAALMLAMWWMMMVAMMLPSAAPMVLLFAAVNRTRCRQGPARAATAVFAGAYLIVWGGFSLAAVALQWGLDRLALISPALLLTNHFVGAALLIAAGLYQLTPLKRACLSRCRSPLVFLAHHWRQGVGGAFRMGLRHGLFCLGCCWLLMALLFYGGIMNLWWIIGLAIYVLIEKLAPARRSIDRLAGGLLLLWGIWALAGALSR